MTVSIIIPSRADKHNREGTPPDERFLAPTVADLYAKATGEIEVIVVLEGYWPEPILPDYPNLHIIHFGEAQGMRQAINAGVAIACGKYVMKTDSHCAFAPGFDEVLAADCQADWVCIPRRYSLDYETWGRKDKAAVDYMYLSYPDSGTEDYGGPGYHGRVWAERNRDKSLRSIEIDDLMSFQGSCWFMERDYFHHLELMDDTGWGPFWQEAQEIGPKAWYAGGRVVRNKRTWYAHLHKGKQFGRGYFLDKRTTARAVAYSKEFMNTTTWHKQQPGRDLRWLVRHFWPVPGWPEEWGP